MSKAKVDLDRREQLLFNEHYSDSITKHCYRGGVRRFDDIPIDIVKKLIEEKFLDPNSMQNESPTVEDFITYAEGHPNIRFTFSGYATNRDSDMDVIIDAITQTVNGEKDTLSLQDIIDFVGAYRWADEFNVSDTECYAWWD